MSIFETGQFDGVTNRGWAIGQFPGAAVRRDDIEVKWANQPKGDAGSEWRTCTTATTLSILISGKFKIDFRQARDAPERPIVLETPGQYVIFGPGIQHRSEALEDTLFLTVRWPSIEADCKVIEDPPTANAG
jgi:hypothetical protein